MATSPSEKFFAKFFTERAIELSPTLKLGLQKIAVFFEALFNSFSMAVVRPVVPETSGTLLSPHQWATTARPWGEEKSITTSALASKGGRLFKPLSFSMR